MDHSESLSAVHFAVIPGTRIMGRKARDGDKF